MMLHLMCSLQGDTSGWLKPPVDQVLTALAAGGLLLQLPTAQARRWNISNISQLEVFTVLMCHHVRMCIPESVARTVLVSQLRMLSSLEVELELR